MTPHATITRFRTGMDGTFGNMTVVRDRKEFHCVTGELPWFANKRRVSCIPNGTYRCELRYSPRFDKQLWHIDGVDNRDGILIHSGNYCGDVSSGYATDTQGCVLVGQRHNRIGETRIVAASRVALADLMRFLAPETEMTLQIMGANIPYELSADGPASTDRADPAGLHAAADEHSDPE